MGLEKPASYKEVINRNICRYSYVLRAVRHFLLPQFSPLPTQKKNSKINFMQEEQRRGNCFYIIFPDVKNDVAAGNDAVGQRTTRCAVPHECVNLHSAFSERNINTVKALRCGDTL
jgi:hypothetical protein